MAAGASWQDHGLIFASEVGTPMDPDNFSHSFARLCEQAGLGHWPPHELRHSGASLMLAQGTPLHVVSEVLGHASIAITKDVYGHLLEGDKRAAAESMSRALWGRTHPCGSQRGSQETKKGASWGRVAKRTKPRPVGCQSGPCSSLSQTSALGGTRTPNLLIRSQMLYPLSYQRLRLG